MLPLWLKKYLYFVIALLAFSSCSKSVNDSSHKLVLKAPKIVASPKDKLVTLKWSSIADAKLYRVYKSTDEKFVVSEKNKVNAANINIKAIDTTQSAEISGLLNDIKYYFVVVAANGKTVSPNSNKASATPSGALNETGITKSVDYEGGNNSSCTSNTAAPQDCDYGRDAQAEAGTLTKLGSGKAVFNFTKLGANGQALITQNKAWDDNGSEVEGTKWSCVKDNHTGLVWEVKTNDGGIHAKDIRYRWGGKTALGRDHSDKGGTYYDDWNELVERSNTNALCGRTNWRVPTREELHSIVDDGRHNPSIDTAYFPHTQSSWYWSSSPDADSQDYAWYVFFYNGYDDNDFRNNNRCLRLVSAR